MEFTLEIKPLDLTVKNLLETGFYKIPRFQRPYSWDRENVEDFWEDAIHADDPDYFIGSFVLYRAKDDPDLLFVVDGQQRLTTITLLLAAIRDALHDLGSTQLRLPSRILLNDRTLTANFVSYSIPKPHIRICKSRSRSMAKTRI